MGDKLLPCPFCGGEAKRVDTPPEADEGGASYIECTRCCACTGLHYDRKENLQSSWNQRVLASDRATNRIEELETAVKEAIELLLETRHGSPARSAGHNARLCLQAAIETERYKNGC